MDMRLVRKLVQLSVGSVFCVSDVYCAHVQLGSRGFEASTVRSTFLSRNILPFTVSTCTLLQAFAPKRRHREAHDHGTKHFPCDGYSTLTLSDIWIPPSEVLFPKKKRRRLFHFHISSFGLTSVPAVSQSPSLLKTCSRRAECRGFHGGWDGIRNVTLYVEVITTVDTSSWLHALFVRLRAPSKKFLHESISAELGGVWCSVKCNSQLHSPQVPNEYLSLIPWNLSSGMACNRLRSATV